MTCFIDTNVFIHAILEPTRALEPHEKEIKKSAKKILSTIKVKDVAISTVHISEIANILEARMGLDRASMVISSIINMDSLTIYSVTEGHVKAASVLSQGINLGFNDTIAYILMQENEISKIYSFDRDFDKLPEIIRISS